MAAATRKTSQGKTGRFLAVSGNRGSLYGVDAGPPGDTKVALSRTRGNVRDRKKKTNVAEGKSPFTTSAVEILNRRLLTTPAAVAMMHEVRADADIAEKIYQLREAAGLTQKQLAELAGTKASVICRLEDADYDGHSMAMLRRIASALGKRVVIEFAEA